MTERRLRRRRDRLVGGLAILAALTLALVVVGIRLAADGDERLALLPAPTSAPLPTPPPTAPPATPPTTPGPSPQLTEEVAPDGRNVVCLDPGHGGSDRGKIRERNDGSFLQEKDLTLAHALALGPRLQARGIEVVYTRTTDVEANPGNLDINGDGKVAPPDGEATSDEADDLQARINTCNAANADLLVSMHYNSAENEFLEGYEVWYNRERTFSDRSLAFASAIHQRLGPSMAEGGYPAQDHGLGTEDFFVLGPGNGGRKPSRMPGAIVEGLYLSNDEDAAFVVTDAAMEAIVGAYEGAIVEYFAAHPG